MKNTARKSRSRHDNLENSRIYNNCGFARLQGFDSRGRIYIPKFVRSLFRGYRFVILVENGKIVLDPIKIDNEGDFYEDW